MHGHEHKKASVTCPKDTTQRSLLELIINDNTHNAPACGDELSIPLNQSTVSEQ
jgi:hypothetical protein